MGGICYELTPHGICLLDALGELVELVRHLGQLVLTLHRDGVSVAARVEGPDGGQQIVHPPGHHPGQDDADQHGEDTDHQGDVAQVGLQPQ